MSFLPAPFNSESPARGHSEGMRDNGRMSDVIKGMFHWTRKRLPSPGVQNYAWETLGLVEFTVIGPATANLMQYRSIQGPQVYLAGQAVVTNSLGGLQTGQAIFQPLFDPNSGMYGNGA